MKRIILTLAAAAALTLATGLPVASSDFTQATVSCDDGTSFTEVLDADTLASLVQSVEAMTLYPAGLSCTVLQAPVVHALGGMASAWPGGGFIVGGGRYLAPCANGLGFYWLNFAVSAHTETVNPGAVRGGTLNFTAPGGQLCIGEGHVTSKPTCLKINAEQPKPPDGTWFAYMWSHVTQKSDSLTFFPDDFGAGWADNGNPSQPKMDRVALDSQSTCPSDGSPDPNGVFSRPIPNGNITIHAAP